MGSHHRVRGDPRVNIYYICCNIFCTRNNVTRYGLIVGLKGEGKKGFRVSKVALGGLGVSFDYWLIG